MDPKNIETDLKNAKKAYQKAEAASNLLLVDKAFRNFFEEEDDSQPATEQPQVKLPQPEPEVNLEEEIKGAKTREELICLVKELAEERDELNQALTNPTPSSVVKLIYEEKPYSIRHFKSLDQKRSLLQEAVKLACANTILTVILFLKDTLATKFWVDIIKDLPEAIDVYVNYLKKDELDGYRKLLKLYQALGKVVEEGMLMLMNTYKIESPTKRLENMKQCLAFFSKHDSLKIHAPYITSQVSLLEKQLAVEAQDTKSEKPLFHKFPRTSITGKTLSDTLFYYCLYHAQEPESADNSPISFKKHFQVSERRYAYTELQARAKSGEWDLIKQNLTKKGSFFPTSFTTFSAAKPVLSLDVFLETAVTYNAPQDFQKYVASLIPAADRYKIATDLKLYPIAVEAVVELKDKALAQKLKTLVVAANGSDSPLVAALNSV
eukprot:TRINITY_DN10164_c0_g1_i1.p1 TRINITY_DN10164_c0_g1~~TRINITY_DN10164_c0_g1_i1.p1  ORF type:complete len:436 (-),score=95.66 TRINITY_DN10164_c0_g1_i1:17-1324(-)